MIKYKTIFLSILFVLSAYSVPAQGVKTKPKTGLAAKYDFVGSFNSGVAVVRLKGKWGYVDSTGNIVLPLRYDETVKFSDGFGRMRTAEKWGLVDATGKIIIKPTFDWIYDFENGVAKVKLNGETYYMNKEGQRVK